MFIMGAGYCIGSIATSASMINLMIILVAIGTAFFKGNISAVNGQVINNKEELDSAFSLQYSIVNVGSFLGSTLVGILYLKIFAKNGILGFSQCLILAGILCVIGGLWFIFGWRFLGEAGKRPFKEGLGNEKTEKINKTALTLSDKKKSFSYSDYIRILCAFLDILALNLPSIL